MILGHGHLQERGHNFCILFKEMFYLGQFHPPQNWARNMRLQLLQNLKQEENNGGDPILQFEMMENGVKWALEQQKWLLSSSHWNFWV